MLDKSYDKILFISNEHLDNDGLKLLFRMKITKKNLTMLLNILSFFYVRNVKNLKSFESKHVDQAPKFMLPVN